ncbi:hypothetical protein CRENBAI_003946 [Crenichthys baileyi]|uniref:Uncharacterized protein n=1 Tax=Crenichthys baileyi TaxID=28760 RepID=A0AAV9S888_9TELE
MGVLSLWISAEQCGRQDSHLLAILYLAAGHFAGGQSCIQSRVPSAIIAHTGQLFWADNTTGVDTVSRDITHNIIHRGNIFKVLTECFRQPRTPRTSRRQTSWIAGFSVRRRRMRNLPTDLEVLPSPLLLEQMEREAVLRRSPPSPLAAHSGPAVKASPSSRHKKRRCGAPSCGSAGEEVFSLPADVRSAASKPASLSATALSAKLAAPPPMPSSLAPARCSEATPDELEKGLRFYARQIKSFRMTSLMYSST